MNKAQRKKTKRIICEALLWRYMHSKSICPRNHETGYYNGWFEIDGHSFQRPDLVAEAEYLIDNGCYGKYRHVDMASIPTVFDAEENPVPL